MSYEDAKCPSCGAAHGAHTQVGGDDDGGPPRRGDAMVCLECGCLAIYTQKNLRKPTPEESNILSELPEVKSVRAILVLRSIVTAVGQAVIETEDGAELPANDDVLHAVGIELREDGDGNLRVVSSSEEMPEGLRRVVEEMLQDREQDRRAHEIAKHITMEVAHHVLAIYGDDEASYPSVAIAELIGLIRTCRQSNEDLLRHLNGCEMIHGYILAVEIAEKRIPDDPKADGLHMLRVMAALDPMDEEKGTYRRVNTKVGVGDGG